MANLRDTWRNGRNGTSAHITIDRAQLQRQEAVSSRIPGFYRLPVERRLAFLARSFDLNDQQVSELREGRTLRIEHAVNMVENAIGVHGMPLGVALNFLVDGRDFLCSNDGL